MHYYKVFNVSMTWPDAKEYCKSIGGHLITITSPKEQLIAEKLLDNSSPNKYQYWIGLDLNYNSWVTGELVKYSNWDEIEPNYHTRDDGEVEHYVHMLNMENPNVPGNKRFAWNDMFYDNTFPGEEGFFSLDNVGFICEWDSGECDDMPTPTPTLDFEMQSNYCPINDHAVMFGEIVDNNCDGRIEDIVKNITWTIDDNSVAEILETSHICSVDGNSALIDLTIIGHKAGKTTVTGIAPNGMKTDATIYVEPEMEDIEYSQTNEPTTLVYGVDLGYSDADYLDDFLKNLKCMVSTENNNMTITGTRYSISDDGALGFYYVDTEPSIIYGRGDEDAEIEITSEGGQTAKIKTCVKRVIPSYYDTYKPSTWDEVENAANEFIASTDDYMNSVLNVMQSGDDEALQKEALRRKCALEMLEKDNASYSKILTFGSINDDNIKLNAYEALYDALEKARENAGVNLGDIKFSGDLIKNNTGSVKRKSE